MNAMYSEHVKDKFHCIVNMMINKPDFHDEITRKSILAL